MQKQVTNESGAKSRTTRPLNTAELLATKRQKQLYRPIQPLVERLFDFPRALELYKQANGETAQADAFSQDVLKRLKIEWSLAEADIERLRQIKGPIVIAANHPMGGIDSFSLIALLCRIRGTDWRIFSNHILKDVRPLAPHLIPVDALSTSARSRQINARAMRDALAHLKNDGCLALFPASRVAYRDKDLGGVIDFEWSSHAVKLAARAGAHLVCIHVPGHNSERFLRIPNQYPKLRGLMLCRELTQAPPRTLDLRITTMLSPEDTTAFAKDPLAAAKLRARVMLEDDLRKHPGAEISSPEQTVHSEPAGDIQEPATAPDEQFSLFSKAPFQVFLFRGDASPETLKTIGRARSITFRAAGQGTGEEIDLSQEDDYYHHLIVWDTEAGRLAGAYRIGIVPHILQEFGPTGLYLDHVFHIDPSFYERFPRSMELSRSFVLPEYQKDNRVLPLLWKGLAAAATRHEVDTLFGSVTISNAHHPASRALLVEYLKNNYAETPEVTRLIQARSPFVPETRYHPLVAEAYAGEGINALSPIIDDIEKGERGIPPLMRYYCQLGAKYINYHVEAEFGDALYCLLQVHLPSIPPAYKKRFFGSSKA